MKLVFACLLLAATAAAEPWPLERLFTRPFAWGTRPQALVWSKQGHTLAFLWNEAGGSFLDLYAYHPESRRLVRISDLSSQHDPLNRTPAERDDIRKNYPLPDEGVSAFALSRDGRQAVFSWRGDVYLARTAGSPAPLRVTRTKADETGAQLSPNGTRVAYMRDGQIFTQDLDTGQLWQVTDIGGNPGEEVSLDSYAWSPDGTRFLFTVKVGSGRKLLLPNLAGSTVTAPSFSRSLAGDMALQHRTYVIPDRGGTPVLLEPGPWGDHYYVWDTPEWSPDSRFILQRLVHPDLKKAQIVVQDAATGKATVVAEDRDPAWVEPLFATWSPASTEVLFRSERDGWAHLYAVSRNGGTPRQLTRGAWEVDLDGIFGYPPQWVEDGIYFASTEAGTAERQFYRIRPDGSGKQQISQRAGLNVGAASADGRYAALLAADLDHPFDLYVNRERITKSARPEFAEYAWPRTRFVQFPSRADGKAVAAKLLLPPGYNPEDRTQKPRPAILFVHGSGYATSVLKQWGSYHELRYAFNCYLANRGYLILDIDYRGSSGYGRDWRTGVYLHLGGRDLADLLGGVDYLRSLGNIDMRRIGIWGSSYGGFLTNMALFLSPETFRAGAGFSAVNDWANYNAFYTEQRLTRPADHPEAYRRSSPIYFSGMLRHPLLVVHGMVDNNVMFQDAVQLTEKLIHEGREFSQAYYPEESHLFARDETLIDAFGRASDFFDRYLR